MANSGVRLVTEIDGVPSHCWHATRQPAQRVTELIPRLYAKRSSNLLSEDDIEELNAHRGVWEERAR